tara:strand:- start:1170 stop:1346 length:177 start_codon:yes stop_codon:yes gene_type:complete
MRFVKFETNGRPVYVNPKKVTIIEQHSSHNARTVIHVGRTTTLVDMPIEEVTRKLVTK